MMSFESFVKLGWSFFKTVLRAALPRKSELQRFSSQYRTDGMLSAEASDHAVYVAAGRCLGCGACDLKALESGAATALGPLGPMAFVQSVSRHPGMSNPLGDGADAALLKRLEAVCPVQVPFVSLAAVVRRRHGELSEARRGLQLPARS